MIGKLVGRQKRRTPEDLTLEELLSGMDVGEYGSWYEHEILRKVGERYARACAEWPDGERFLFEEAPALPGYDERATEAVYRSRGIEDAFVLNLPENSRFSCPAVALYLEPDLREGDNERFSMVRFYEYTVLPRFYERLTGIDFPANGLGAKLPRTGARAGIGAGGPVEEESDLWPEPGRSFGVRPGGIGRAIRYAADLAESMAQEGVLCEPVVALGEAEDYDPHEAKDTHVPDPDPHHPYKASEAGRPWEPGPIGRYRKPRGHRVVVGAGPKAPDQETADELLRALGGYRWWEGRVEDLERRLFDPEIPAKRKAVLAEELKEAREFSRRKAEELTADRAALLGLLMSMDDALRRLTEHVYPLMYYRPEEAYPPELCSLWHLQAAVGGLFEGERSDHGRGSGR